MSQTGDALPILHCLSLLRKPVYFAMLNALLLLHETRKLTARWWHARKQMALFKGLSEANMNSITKRMKVKNFKDGDEIVKQGTIGTTMYFIDLGGARAVVGDTVAQTLASGDFFGEMAFASTCHKVLKGADEAASSDNVKRSCDVLAIGSTRCLELSVKDFLGVLQDDLVGSRSALRAIAHIAPLIDKRRKTVMAIKEGSFGRASSTSGDDEQDRKQTDEENLRSHAGYAQDIILANGSQEIMRRRMEKSRSTSSSEALEKQFGLFVPGRAAAHEKDGPALMRRRSGWSARNGSNREVDLSRPHGQVSVSTSRTSSRANSRAPSQSSSRQASPRCAEDDRPSTATSNRSTARRVN